MSEDLSTVTLGELIARVGGVVNDDGTVRFGSPMAVQAMLDKLARHYQEQVQAVTDDCACAVNIAKVHISRVNVELAEKKLQLHMAMEALGQCQVPAAIGPHGTPGVH